MVSHIGKAADGGFRVGWPCWALVTPVGLEGPPPCCHPSQGTARGKAEAEEQGQAFSSSSFFLLYSGRQRARRA